MKITEITKEKAAFVRKLKDPAAQEISDITDELTHAVQGYSFDVYNTEKEIATIIGNPPGIDIETQESNLIEYIKGVISNSQYWEFKAFFGNVEEEEEFSVYVVRKT